MKTALVCGSRDYDDREQMKRVLARALETLDPWLTEDIRVIHGGARGADRLAAEILSNSIYEVQEFPADWERHGKAAGPIRNRQMLDELPDLVIAFPVGESRGTWDTINEARRRGFRVVVAPTQQQEENDG